MSEIVIASRNHAENIKRRGFDGVLSIASPGAEVLRYHPSPAPPQLVLRMDDIVAPERRGLLPTLEMVRNGLLFARRFASGRLLVQCEAGVSRSGAFGIAILADRLGPGHESEALEASLARAPEIIPNLLIVRLADEALGRGGALAAVVDAWDAQFPAHSYRRAYHQALIRGDRYAAILAQASFEKLIAKTPKRVD